MLDVDFLGGSHHGKREQSLTSRNHDPPRHRKSTATTFVCYLRDSFWLSNQCIGVWPVTFIERMSLIVCVLWEFENELSSKSCAPHWFCTVYYAKLMTCFKQLILCHQLILYHCDDYSFIPSPILYHHQSEQKKDVDFHYILWDENASLCKAVKPVHIKEISAI